MCVVVRLHHFYLAGSAPAVEDMVSVYENNLVTRVETAYKVKMIEATANTAVNNSIKKVRIDFIGNIGSGSLIPVLLSVDQGTYGQ